ncbi:MAG: hypothetical protein LBJ62_11390 [Bifidobacteriaceae bacterium]|jgi:hypothetical protein|nr:hypothetical protein [Bifidobacteriaceae bacterium]
MPGLERFDEPLVLMEAETLKKLNLLAGRIESGLVFAPPNPTLTEIEDGRKAAGEIWISLHKYAVGLVLTSRAKKLDAAVSGDPTDIEMWDMSYYMAYAIAKARPGKDHATLHITPAQFDGPPGAKAKRKISEHVKNAGDRRAMRGIGLTQDIIQGVISQIVGKPDRLTAQQIARLTPIKLAAEVGIHLDYLTATERAQFDQQWNRLDRLRTNREIRIPLNPKSGTADWHLSAMADSALRAAHSMALEDITLQKLAQRSVNNLFRFFEEAARQEKRRLSKIPAKRKPKREADLGFGMTVSHAENLREVCLKWLSGGRLTRDDRQAVRPMHRGMYYGGALGPPLSLRKQRSVQRAVDAWSPVFGGNRLSNELSALRRVLDFASVCAELTEDGSIANLVKFERLMTAELDSGGPDGQAMVYFGAEPGEPTKYVLHGAERTASSMMFRIRPDCVLMDGCKVTLRKPPSQGGAKP